jgi:hypothetical protein
MNLEKYARPDIAGTKPTLTMPDLTGSLTPVFCQRSSAVEQRFRKAKVAGSIPAAGSISKQRILGMLQ